MGREPSPGLVIARVRLGWFGEVHQMSAIGTQQTIEAAAERSACLGAADDLGQVQDRRRPKATVTEF